MKIAHLVLGKANPNRMNGVNKVIHDLSLFQHNIGDEVTILCITKNSSFLSGPEHPVRRIFFQQSKIFLSFSCIRQLRELGRQNYIVHIHGAFIPVFFLCAVVLKFFKIPYIFTPHGAYNSYALKKNYFIKIWYLTLIERWILIWASKVHFLAKSEAEFPVSRLNLVNYEVIPNGQTVPEKNGYNWDPKIGENKGKRIFGFIGRLDIRHKGLDNMIKGFSSFIRSGGSGELRIAGDGPDRLRLHSLCESLNISSYVKFCGPLFKEDKTNFLQNIDVFVHCSRFEGFPMSVLEAASFGKSLMISEETNMGDYIRKYNAGKVLEQNTTEKIEQTFALYSDNVDLKIMSENARTMVEKEFSWANINSRIYKL